MADYIEREDPYDKIGNAVEQWCKENMYTTMLVTISIGYEWETPHEETHLLEWDSESCSLVWEVDWWEGQQHVELVGFAPTYKIRLVGADAEVAPVRHAKDIWYTVKNDHCEFKCSLCGREIPEHWGGDFDYCPYCGAKLDGGNDG